MPDIKDLMANRGRPTLADPNLRNADAPTTIDPTTTTTPPPPRTGVDNVDPAMPPNAGQPPAPTGNVADTNRPAPGTVSPIDVQTPASTDDGIPKAQLNPTGKPVALTTGMKTVIGAPKDKLDLGVLNETFNPHRATLGDFTDAGQIYTARVFVPTRDLIGAVAQQGGADLAALAPALGALPEASVHTAPVHQFAIDGADKAPGNRVVLYGGGTGHAHIDQAVHEAGKKHMRVIKQMVHFNAESQGGTPQDVVGDGVAGATHAGGLSSGFHGGKPASIKSDWPSDYGSLDDGNIKYNAHLIAIDYQAGTKDTVPGKTLAAWKDNADMIDAIAGMVVPFASGDLDPRYTNYKFNPLEVHDRASSAAVMSDLASLDRQTLLQKHGAFYCAEGQYSVASMAWQDKCLLKKSQFGDTQLGKLVDAFQAAPNLQRNDKGQVTNPEAGWQHLEDSGLITGSQHQALKDTDRTATALQWVPEETKGVEAYGCKNPEGMIAEPMSVATMAWGLLRTYMPREGLAKTMAADIAKAYQGGDAAVQQGISALIGGENPTTPAGQKALGGLCMKAASGLLMKILSSDDFRNQLLQQCGFEEITNQGDKDKVLGLYSKFVGTLQSADLTNQAALDAALKGIDKEFKSLVVERNDFDPLSGQTTGQRKGLMLFAAPQCFGFWTQQPDPMGGAGVLRYLATAQHEKQSGV